MYTLYKLLSVLFVASAIGAPTNAPPSIDHYDVIVIGGGPAGLSATSGLARVRRNVLMLDSGDYRNAATRHMHDVIGNDGTVPAAFRALARQQIMRYPTAHMQNATVTSIEGNTTSGFQVKTSDGHTISSTKLVLATGMRDVMPSTPGIAENWGKGIFWCPWCDGYEHRDQPFGIFGPLDKVLDTVFEVANLETDIIALVNGTDTPETIAKIAANPPSGYNDWEKKLEAYNIKIDNRTIESVTRTRDGGSTSHKRGSASSTSTSNPLADAEYDGFLVTFTDKSTLSRNAFIANFPTVQRSTLGASLNLPMNAKQHLMTDDKMQSSISGLYIVGDANADNSTNVPHAMWSGKRAAVAIHIAIEEERSNTLVKKADLEAVEMETGVRMGRGLEAIYEELQRI